MNSRRENRVGVVRRVVITGIGLLAPTGIGIDPFWRSLLEGPSGVGWITRFDTTDFACRIGGEIRDESYQEILHPRKLRTAAHASQLALAASQLAISDARLPAGWYAPETVGVTIGTALGGCREAEQQYAVLHERGLRRVNPFVFSGAPNHSPGVEVAAAIQAKGMQATFSTGCPSSLQAIGNAFAALASEDCESCISGGTESPLTPMIVGAMTRTQELSTSDQPADASRPFDRAHNGLVLSEGACLLVLEWLDKAVKRGARPYAEVLGFASSCDADGLYELDQSGRCGAGTIHRLLQRCELQPIDIDYVCAHANGLPAFDYKETAVIKMAFGECAARLPVSSIKGVLGHPLGASGAFQVAAACLALHDQVIPPTYNLDVPAPNCDLDYVAHQPRHASLRRVLVTSYGNGGVNGYLVLARPDL